MVSMIEYNKNGLKCSVPASVTVDDDFPILRLIFLDNKADYLSIILQTKSYSFAERLSEFLQPPFDSDETKHQLICQGNYDLFPMAKEKIYKIMALEKAIFFRQIIIPPLNSNFGFIEMLASGSSMEILDKVWAPIIVSIKFEPEKFVPIPDHQVLEIDWSSSIRQPQHLRHLCRAEFGKLTFHDNAFEPDSDDYDAYVTDQEFDDKVFKKLESVIFHVDNWSELKVDLYLNEPFPDISSPAFDHVAEGMVAIYSGKLSFLSDIVPDLIISMPKGIYKFRVYMSGLAFSQDPHEEYSIYFLRAEEKDNDKVAIIKRFEGED